MARGTTMRRLARWVRSYWGLLVVLFLAVNLDGHLGVLPYVLLTVAVLGWTLFFAPARCGALNRRRNRELEYCRNNASGLMLGCHIRQHKWQRFTSTWWSENWRDRTRGIWDSASAKFSTVAGVVGITTGIAGMIFAIVDHFS